MINPTKVSHDYAQRLAPGEHRLDNHALRVMYGLSRVTAKARTGVAHELRRAGLEILSDPAEAPLVVRKPARARAAVRPRPVTSRPWWRRPWAIAIAGLVLLMVIAGALDDNKADAGDGKAKTTVADTTTTQSTATMAAAPAPTETIADAQRAVDDNHYAAAVAIAAALGHDDERHIGRRISRRLAGRALFALSTGNRSRAGYLLGQADRYPSTPAAVSAQRSYRAAVARAAARAEARRRARAARAAARRQAAEARRQAREAAAAAEAAAGSAPDTSSTDTSGPSSFN